MTKLTNIKVTKSMEIARILCLEHKGADIVIRGVCSANKLIPHTLTYVKNKELLGKIMENNVRPIVIITQKGVTKKWQDHSCSDITLIFSEKPRLSFIRAMNLLLEQGKSREQKSFIHPTAIIAKNVKIGKSCHILANVYLGSNTKLGDNVFVHPNVIIYGDTTIGSSVIIHSNTVIGKPGFGYEKDEDGCWIKFPHVGKVIIEDNVEIGSCVSVDRGALEDTIIGSGTKIDNLVHIGHAITIGKNCVLTAAVQTAGGVIGDNTWIGPNSSMISHIKIGKNCLIGIGSVVVKDIPDNLIVAGNPAMPINDLKKLRKAFKKLID